MPIEAGESPEEVHGFAIENGALPDTRAAAALRGFGPAGILAILIILAGNVFAAPLGAVLALAWAAVSDTPWRELGFARPRSWVRSLAIGIVFGVAFKLLLKAIVMPLLAAPPLNQTYHYLAGNRAALPGMLFAVIIRAGLGEEILFRGYLFERLGKLFGTGLWSTVSILLLTTAVFALAHYQQGLPGVEQAAVTGLVFGAIFAITNRLWIPMAAHAAFDLAALGLIYWNLEAGVAHLIFN